MSDLAKESDAPWIALTETWLKPEIVSAEVQIPGMQLFRADREGRRHRGCALYVRNDLNSQLVTTHSNRSCDTLVVKIKTLNLIIIVNYRPPDAKEDEFQEQLNVCQEAIDGIVEKDSKVRDIFQVGDFNMKCISWPSRKIYTKDVQNKATEKKQAEMLIKYADENFLENCVKSATRGGNILDLCFTNNHTLITNHTLTVNQKFSDHNLLETNLSFTYNKDNIKKKRENPYKTKIYEYDTEQGDEEDWMRFEKLLDLINIEKEFGGAKNVEEKIKKFYELLETTSAIVFKKKKGFEDDVDQETKKGNKIPKKIRQLMKRKKKVSAQLLSSKSWQKNFGKMEELRAIEEELDENYKTNRKKKEKEAIQKLLRNPKFFYSYQRKFAKTSDKITGLIDENGTMITDTFKQSEMLRKQYESVYSQPMGRYLVGEEFFTGCEDCLQELTHECWEDKWNYPHADSWKPESCSHRNGSLPFCLFSCPREGEAESCGVADSGILYSAPLAYLGSASGAKIVPNHDHDRPLTSSEVESGENGSREAGNHSRSCPLAGEGTLQSAPLAKLGSAPGAKIVPKNNQNHPLTLTEVGGGEKDCLEAGAESFLRTGETSPAEGTSQSAPLAKLGRAQGAKIVPHSTYDRPLTLSEVARAGNSSPGCSDCKILKLAGVKEGDLNDPYFDHEDFAIALDKLSGSAAPGPDGVPAIMLKRGKRQISRILSEIFKTSFDSGKLPDILKSSYIIPIHKGESRAEPSNYRNVSLTSHLIKSFERVLVKPLVRYLEVNGWMDSNQHGGRAGRSTLSQLILHHDKILQAMEEGKNIDAIYLDFAKAFDKVDHGLLLHKLKRMGVKGKLGRWIQTFLKGRTNEVLVGDVKSLTFLLKSGIPQGSVLGPILFLIYVTDIGNELSVEPLVYVDDTKVLKEIESEEDVEKLQEDLKKLHNWGKKNNMEFNKGKFVVLRYGKDKEIKESTTYFSGDTEEVIEEKESTRDLGVIMQSDACFDEQIEKVCKKVRQKAGWLFRTFYNRQSWFLRHMWNSLVQPHIDYCSQLWAPGEGGNLQKLEKLLKDFTSKIPEVSETTYWERLKMLKMNSQQRRFERYRIIYVWKTLEKIVPNANVCLASDETDRVGRKCKVPTLKPRERKKREESFQVSGPMLFNCLPKEIRNLKNVGVEEFKEHLDLLLSTVPDEPKLGGAMPLNCEKSNSIIHQIRRGFWKRSDTPAETF